MNLGVLMFPWANMRQKYDKHAGSYRFILIFYSLTALLLSFVPFIGAYAVLLTLVSLTISVPLVMLRNLNRSKIVPVLATLLLLVALVFNIMRISDVGWVNFWNSLLLWSSL